MALSAALDVAAMGASPGALLILQGVLAMIHMACRALLHLLGVVAGIVHVLVTELALHHSLLFGMSFRPT
jgi:hypothetical protein